MERTGRAALQISSKRFQAGEEIPSEYTCDGKNINPPLSIDSLPNETQSLALIMEDPDAPSGLFVHWVVYDIDPVLEIGEDSVPGIEGKNHFNDMGYGGPCPPGGSHRYFFRIFALDRKLNLPRGTSRQDLESAMEGHILASGDLMGRYERKDTGSMPDYPSNMHA